MPFCPQVDSKDCGAACLAMVATYHGRRYSNQALRDLCNQDRQGMSLNGIARGAEKIGFRTVAAKVAFEALKARPILPCVAYWRTGHFVVVYRVHKGKVHVADPAIGLLTFTEAEFQEMWIATVEKGSRFGIVLLLEPTPAFYEVEIGAPEKRRFSALRPYLQEYKPALFQLTLGAFVLILVQALAPFLSLTLIDAGLSSANASLVHIVIVGQLVLSLSRVSVDMFQTWSMSLVGSRINLRLISNFLLKLTKLPLSFFDSRIIGDLTQRVRDHDRIRDFLTQNVVRLAMGFLSLIVFGTLLAIFQWRIFLVFAIGSILHILAISAFLKKRRSLDAKNFVAMAENQGVLMEFLVGMQEIKLNNAEQQRRWEWEQSQYKIQDINIKNLRVAQLEQASATLVNEFKNLIITFMSAQQVLDQHISLGAMMAIQYMIGQLSMPLAQSVSLLQRGQECGMSMERANEVQAIPDEEDPAAGLIPIAPGDISISSMAFRYSGTRERLVLRDINLRIPLGKTTAIVGTSGSGKTTLLKLLLKFYSPSEGEIRLGRGNLKDVSHFGWRQMCGVVMQDGYIFSDSIANNIAIGQERVDRVRLAEVVRVAQLEEVIESLPLRYNTRIGRDGVGLSKGQLQRILLARALYKDPQYLFLDEATSALDAETESLVVEHLRRTLVGKTVVVIAHRLSTVRHADQIVVLEKGAITECGSHASLVALRGRYYELIRNQLELGE